MAYFPGWGIPRAGAPESVATICDGRVGPWRDRLWTQGVTVDIVVSFSIAAELQMECYRLLRR